VIGSSSRAHTTRPRTFGRSASGTRYTSTVQGNSGSTSWIICPVLVSWARDTSIQGTLVEMSP
jgi:hypothetical protein